MLIEDLSSERPYKEEVAERASSVFFREVMACLSNLSILFFS